MLHKGFGLSIVCCDGTVNIDDMTFFYDVRNSATDATTREVPATELVPVQFLSPLALQQERNAVAAARTNSSPSLTPTAKRLAEIGRKAAADMSEISKRCPCAVCACGVQTTDTTQIKLTEAPPAKWVNKLRATPEMQLHPDLRTQYQLRDDLGDVHCVWKTMLLYPESQYTSGTDECSVDVCDACNSSLGGTGKHAPKNSIVSRNKHLVCARSTCRVLRFNLDTVVQPPMKLMQLLRLNYSPQANGNYRGFVQRIPELAALTEAVSDKNNRQKPPSGMIWGCPRSMIHDLITKCQSTYISFPTMQEFDMLRSALTRKVTKVQLSFSGIAGEASAVRLTTKTSVSARKLCPAEYKDCVDNISTPTVATHVVFAAIKADAPAVRTAMQNRRSIAKIRTAQYVAAYSKLEQIKPSFSRPNPHSLALDDHDVPVGALLFSFGDSPTTPPHDSALGETPATVADAHGTQIPGRTTMIIGEDPDGLSDGKPEIIVGATGYENMWSQLGHYKAFPDIYPFDRGGESSLLWLLVRPARHPCPTTHLTLHDMFSHGRTGPDEERPVKMSWQTHASLALRQWDRTAAKNQVWILVFYDAVIRKLATRDSMSAASRAAAGDPTSAVQVTVSRLDLAAAMRYHDARASAHRSGAQPPTRPVGLSSSAEQMLRSLNRSIRLMPGTSQYALNRRNQFWSLNSYLGMFTHWNTTSQADATDSIITDIALGRGNGNRTPETVLNANAADVGACVTYYTAIVDIYIKHILGWDVKAHKSVPGGGVFGEISGNNMFRFSTSYHPQLPQQSQCSPLPAAMITLRHLVPAVSQSIQGMRIDQSCHLEESRI